MQLVDQYKSLNKLVKAEKEKMDGLVLIKNNLTAELVKKQYVKRSRRAIDWFARTCSRTAEANQRID